MSAQPTERFNVPSSHEPPYHPSFEASPGTPYGWPP